MDRTDWIFLTIVLILLAALTAVLVVGVGLAGEGKRKNGPWSAKDCMKRRIRERRGA